MGDGDDIKVVLKGFDQIDSIFSDLGTCDGSDQLIGFAVLYLLTGRDNLRCQLGTDIFFDALDRSELTGGYECDRFTFFACATRTADTMHITLGIKRDMVVENMGDIIDIQTTRCHIGSDKDIDTTLFEPTDGYFALFLLHVTMEAADFESLRSEMRNQPIDLFFHTTEDDTFVGGFEIDQTHQCIIALSLLYNIIVLCNIFIGALCLGDRDGFGLI